MVSLSGMGQSFGGKCGIGTIFRSLASQRTEEDERCPRYTRFPAVLSNVVASRIDSDDSMSPVGRLSRYRNAVLRSCLSISHDSENDCYLTIDTRGPKRPYQ
jgi:hypothetical protein